MKGFICSFFKGSCTYVPLPFLCLIFLISQSAFAHKYFFAISDINVNHHTQTLEIIHQFTIHDVENAIAEQQQIKFSPEHPRYEKLIQQYFEKHFKIQNNNTSIKLSWIGLELVRDKLWVYQESDSLKNFNGLVVKNDLLIDTYPEQINTVNFQNNNDYISVTFSKSKQVATIGK
jgi:hypothetical protein